MRRRRSNPVHYPLTGGAQRARAGGAGTTRQHVTEASWSSAEAPTRPSTSSIAERAGHSAAKNELRDRPARRRLGPRGRGHSQIHRDDAIFVRALDRHRARHGRRPEQWQCERRRLLRVRAQPRRVRAAGHGAGGRRAAAPLAPRLRLARRRDGLDDSFARRAGPAGRPRLRGGAPGHRAPRGAARRHARRRTAARARRRRAAAHRRRPRRPVRASSAPPAAPRPAPTPAPPCTPSTPTTKATTR